MTKTKVLLAVGMLVSCISNQITASFDVVAAISAAAGLSTFVVKNPKSLIYSLAGTAGALGYGAIDSANNNHHLNVPAVAASALVASAVTYYLSMKGAQKVQVIFNNNGQEFASREYPLSLKRFAAWATFTGALVGGILAAKI